MGLFKDGEEVFTIGSFVYSDTGNTKSPCGCKNKHKNIRFQYTNCVKGLRFDVAECPQCGATWEDDSDV